MDHGAVTMIMSPSLSECMGSASTDSNMVVGIAGLLQDHVGLHADDGPVPVHVESSSSDVSPSCHLSPAVPPLAIVGSDQDHAAQHDHVALGALEHVTFGSVPAVYDQSSPSQRHLSPGAPTIIPTIVQDTQGPM
jgi:hypothetical protein